MSSSNNHNDAGIYHKLKIHTEIETVNHILKNQSSICRYGDAEFSLATNVGNKYQYNDSELAKKLSDILKGKYRTSETSKTNRSILVGIPRIIGPSRDFWIKQFRMYQKLFSPKVEYYSSLISRGDHCSEVMTEKYWNLWRKIFKNRKIVSIEGGKPISDTPELFSSASSFDIIKAPWFHAYEKYQDILKKAKSYPLDTLFLVGLGATATILSYDLTILGYQAIDIGHLGMFYRRYLEANSSRDNQKGDNVEENKKGYNVRKNRSNNSNGKIKLAVFKNMEKKNFKINMLVDEFRKSSKYKNRIEFRVFKSQDVNDFIRNAMNNKNKIDEIRKSLQDFDFLICHQVEPIFLELEIPIIVLERHDSCTVSLSNSKYLTHPNVIALFKEYKFRHLSMYERKFKHNRYHFDILRGSKDKIEKLKTCSDYHLNKDIIENKIVCNSWNLDQYSHVGDRMLTLAKSPRMKKIYDIFVISRDYRHESSEFDLIKKHRALGKKKIHELAKNKKYKVVSQPCDVRRYLDQLKQSKVCISPYGKGERIALDQFAILAECIVIKPPMDFVRADPDIYHPGADMFEFCQPDWSDVKQITQRVLNNYDYYYKKAKLRKKQLMKYDRAYFLDKFYEEIKKLTK